MSNLNPNLNPNTNFIDNNQRNISVQQTFDRVVFNAYIDMYNATLREIDRLNSVLEDIRSSIQALETNHRNMNLNANRRNNRNSFQGATNSGNSTTAPTHRAMDISYNTNPIPLQTNNAGPAQSNYVYFNGRYYTIDYIIADPQTRTRRMDISGNTFLNDIMENFNEPVNVRPTLEEIRNATTNLVYDSIIEPRNNSCPISLERFENHANVTQIRHCGHIFTPSSLNTWFQTNVRCPVCRYDIRSDTTNQSSDEPIANVLPRETETRTEEINETSNQETNETSNQVPNGNSHEFRVNNENISNIRYTENGDITFDISGNAIANLATQALTDLIRGNIRNENMNINNFLDPSRNPVLLFESIFTRGL